MLNEKGYQIYEYIGLKGKNHFRDWLIGLDNQIKARIQARIFRFETGNLGDYKSVGKGIFEARFDFGPGYRIYFGMQPNKIVVLLIGGDKSSQSKDIKKAQEYWEDYLKGVNHGQKK